MSMNPEEQRKRKRENMRRYRAERPEHYAAQSRKAKAKLKSQLFELYGHECSICGYDDKRALTLDHINNNGSEERKELGERGVYYKAREKHSPGEYRILCMNCQFIERHKHGRQNQHSSGCNSMEIIK